MGVGALAAYKNSIENLFRIFDAEALLRDECSFFTRIPLPNALS
jgi:hypothetical protein